MAISNGAPREHAKADKTKLQVLVCASPFTGHTMPMINIAEQLIWRGFNVAFIAGEEFRKEIDNIGAKFLMTCPFEDFGPIQEEAKSMPELARFTFLCTRLFTEPIAPRMRVLSDALEALKRSEPSHDIIVLTESFFCGHEPLYLGAPLPKGLAKRPKIVNIHAVPYSITSRDTAPFMTAIIPDGKEESREMYRLEYQKAASGVWAEAMATRLKTLTELGCREAKSLPLFDAFQTMADITLQMCPPSLEYRISDVHPRVRFAGALGPRLSKKPFVPPAFWDDVTRGDRKVIVVTQGTVAVDYSQLIIPTLKALSHRSDMIVVAILGVKGASLPPDVVPTNAHVVDFLSYDAVLPYASVFVMNAGYGGFIHGVMNGAPMVMAGTSEEKPEVANRGEYAGVAINLRTATPSEQQLTQAVDTILSDNRYKERVMAIKKENEDMKAMDSVERAILEMAATDSVDKLA